MKILSFIIPAYNSAAFLDKCLLSMLLPEVLDKLEILIINDGSTDATAEISRKYQDKYPGTVRLISQENKGHGGAVNTGCAAASGKYLKAVDADDWIQSESLPEFIRLLEQCESDVVLTHYHTVDIKSGQIKDWCCQPKSFGKLYTLEEILSNWRYFNWNLVYHGITYRRDFYQLHASLLPEHIFYEDYEFATFPCCQAESLVCFDLFLYEYRIGDINQSMAASNQLKRIGQIETVIRRMLKNYQDLLESCSKLYAARKTHELILSYLTVALLINPDKKAGRRQAKKMIDDCIAQAPEIYALVHSKYRVFLFMNYLGLNKQAWDRILDSSIYKCIRGKNR